MNFLPSNPFLENSYGPKPRRLIRITDDESFIKLGIPGHTGTFDPDVGFEVGYSTRYIDFCHRLTPFSVKEHLTWSSLCEWKIESGSRYAGIYKLRLYKSANNGLCSPSSIPYNGDASVLRSVMLTPIRGTPETS